MKNFLQKDFLGRYIQWVFDGVFYDVPTGYYVVDNYGDLIFIED